jgi:Cu2+-exporting ATPase
MNAAVTSPQQPAGSTPGCFHCGLPVPAGAHWSVAVDGESRAMCCPGCEAVAQAIVDSGCIDYYRTRTAYPAAGEQAAALPDALRLYDSPESLARFASTAQGAAPGDCEAILSIEGIRCGACAWLIERRLACVPGVQFASLNMATERLQVRWTAAQCQPSDLLQALRDIGYAAYPYDAQRHEAQLRSAQRKLSRRVFIAGLSMMQVMMYAVPAYLADDGTLDADMAFLMRWACLLLTLPAVGYSALPFFHGAWQNIRNRALGMDVPVALGIGTAFIASVFATWTGQGDTYFDSVTMFIFLLLGSRLFELSARRKAASAMEKLQHALPASASRLRAYPADRSTEIVAASTLREDDMILVKAGEAVAADCVIVEGSTAIDLSLLTGESQPQHKEQGDILAGGALNAAQAVVARVVRPTAESTLSSLIKLVERAGQTKPQLAQRADKAAAWFVACLLVFAVGVFITWHWVDPSRAWLIAVAVLVVSCPCALSLATPSALAAATDRMVRQGILVVQPHVLEALQKSTHVVFDKTGTLTVGKPSLRKITATGAMEAQACLAVAAALEASSAHPLAQAIISSVGGNALPVAHDVTECTGRGVEGSIDGRRYWLGSAAYVAQHCKDGPGEEAPPGVTPVYLGSDDAWLARFDIADAIRSDAHDVVARLRAAGKSVVLLSGDRQANADAVAQELGIAESHGNCLPQQKLEFVQDLQRRGAVVAMVGDGVNDAAVLRAADVSFAMGSGANLAQAHADAVLLSGSIWSVWEAVQAASQTMAVVRQNLAWATAYNLIAIPAAAMGWLNPWLSGIGMSVSSAIVVANAMRLRRSQSTALREAASVAKLTLQPAWIKG